MLAIFSQVSPFLKEAKNDLMESITGKSIDNDYSSIYGVKSDIKQSIRSRIYNMIEHRPVDFFFLVILIAFLLFALGFYLRHVRAFGRFF